MSSIASLRSLHTDYRLPHQSPSSFRLYLLLTSTDGVHPQAGHDEVPGRHRCLAGLRRICEPTRHAQGRFKGTDDVSCANHGSKKGA